MIKDKGKSIDFDALPKNLYLKEGGWEMKKYQALGFPEVFFG
jgi:hypothetical protein